MTIARYLRETGRDHDGACPVTVERACDLTAQVLAALPDRDRLRNGAQSTTPPR
jgi:hypothetical protein